ncbi:PA0069 family radical SAM protein [Mesonia aestuariivivens]|uniref:PA0069 family radical SAM protein n=1 Tax=Mesonia aestuariivivens TaxID=2796128 RepID=A0ABS6W1E4_9FLAO|nr:PA0069 family radical SAM protein [Mesonia aestuariivivens]MBW2961677.1 PA0069 family radical SAM protein [Mesonia aestuariivivens]
MPNNYIKGRGAQQNVHNKFEKLQHTTDAEFLEYCFKEGEEANDVKTRFQDVFPKTIVNKVTSPDVAMEYSLNPYQGCEHGCIYCYVRNSHEYWGYSAGLDFEKQILVKKNAPQLLEQKFQQKKWEPTAIVFSGNTDCYQPAEKKYQLTRECLKVMLKYKHPTGIITKNSLVLRDLDILRELAKLNCIRVSISITSLEEETRRILEPRTATIKQRLKTVEKLTAEGIPVNVMVAPIIPFINSHEILPIVKAVSEVGAYSVGYTIVRLNGAIAEIFKDWIEKTLPDKAERVLHQIEACHGGNLNDNRFGTRMKGEGEFSKQIVQQFRIAKRKYLKNRKIPEMDTSHYLQLKNPQYKLF